MLIGSNAQPLVRSFAELILSQLRLLLPPLLCSALPALRPPALAHAPHLRCHPAAAAGPLLTACLCAGGEGEGEEAELETVMDEDEDEEPPPELVEPDIDPEVRGGVWWGPGLGPSLAKHGAAGTCCPAPGRAGGEATGLER